MSLFMIIHDYIPLLHPVQSNLVKGSNGMCERYLKTFDRKNKRNKR